jgi:hypothetical protein
MGGGVRKIADGEISEGTKRRAPDQDQRRLLLGPPSRGLSEGQDKTTQILFQSARNAAKTHCTLGIKLLALPQRYESKARLNEVSNVTLQRLEPNET